MFYFLVRAFIFDFIYSFLVGLCITVIALPFLAFSNSDEPGQISSLISIVAGIVLCAIQGIMLAAAVVVALEIEPSRWSIAWYLAGFFFSVPIALTRSLGDPEQGGFAGVGILSSNLAYILSCLFPQYIPHVLGDTAVAFLL